MLRARTGHWSCSWVNWEHDWESPRLACSGEPCSVRAGRKKRAKGEKREQWLAEWKQHVKINRYLSVNVCEFAFCARSLFVPAWPVYHAAAHCYCALRALVHVLETTEGSDTGEKKRTPLPPGSSPPSLFFHSFLCSSRSVCMPALPCMSASCVCHGWMWVWQQRVPVLFFFFGSCRGKWGAGEAIEGKKKGGIAGDPRTRCLPQCAGHRQQQYYKYWHHGMIALAD